MSKTYTSLLSLIVVGVCSVRFLFDGMVFGHWTFPHTDDMAYTAILMPVLAAHGYVKTRKDTLDLESRRKAYNPDA